MVVSTFSNFEQSGLKKAYLLPLLPEKNAELFKTLALILVTNTHRPIQQPYPIFRDKMKYQKLTIIWKKYGKCIKTR